MESPIADGTCCTSKIHLWLAATGELLQASNTPRRDRSGNDLPCMNRCSLYMLVQGLYLNHESDWASPGPREPSPSSLRILVVVDCYASDHG